MTEHITPEPAHDVAYALAQAVDGGDPEGAALTEWLYAVLTLDPQPGIAEALVAIQDGLTTPEQWRRSVQRIRARTTPPMPTENRQAFARALLTRTCPVCGAAPGHRCANPVTGRPYAYGAHFRRGDKVPA